MKFYSDTNGASDTMVKFMQRVERGCGNRKTGGNYIVGDGLAAPCYRLPLSIPTCPTCGETIEFFRGIKKINPLKLFGECTVSSHPCHQFGCFVCDPPQKAWIMWVGEQFYSMESFMEEASRMGISKRIHSFPDDIEIGDRVYLAYKKCIPTVLPPEERMKRRNKNIVSVMEPGIFYAFTVTDLQKVMDHRKATKPEEIAKVITNGVTPVVEYDEPEEIEAIRTKIESDDFQNEVKKILGEDTIRTSILSDDTVDDENYDGDGDDSRCEY